MIALTSCRASHLTGLSAAAAVLLQIFLAMATFVMSMSTHVSGTVYRGTVSQRNFPLPWTQLSAATSPAVKALAAS